MDTNYNSRRVFHRSTLTAVGLGVIGLFFLCGTVGALASRSPYTIFLLGAFLFTLLAARFEVRTVTFHDRYVIVDYYLWRKLLIECGDIEHVSIEEKRSSKSIPYEVVCMRLRDGKKISMTGFKEGNQAFYEQLKACESTNEEFLKPRNDNSTG